MDDNHCWKALFIDSSDGFMLTLPTTIKYITLRKTKYITLRKDNRKGTKYIPHLDTHNEMWTIFQMHQPLGDRIW